MKKILVLSLFLLIVLTGCKNAVDSKDANKNDVVNNATENAVSYEIIKIEDLSRKAMGNKSLTDFTQSELESLPTNKKIKYEIVVSKDIKENTVNPTINKIINDITSKDNDIDEIILFLYSDKELITSNGGYDIATVVWAPLGELGNVNSKIATSNNRENYSTKVEIKNNLDEYLNQRGKSEILFGLTEEQRRQFFKDVVSVEDRSRAEANKLVPINSSYSNYESNELKFKELRNKYLPALRKQYNINEEQEKQITSEAFAEGWPLE